MKRSDRFISWGICIAGALLYLITMEPAGGYWDSSEWIATAVKLEVGHPPGAPFYILLARLFAIFSFGSGTAAAFLVNLLSVVASALTLYFLYHTIRMLLVRIGEKAQFATPKAAELIISGSSAIGALAYAVSDTFWNSANEAEVYSLSSLFTAIVVWAILRWDAEHEKPGSSRWLYLIALLIGLSVGTHLLNMLAIPAIVFVFGFRMYRMNWKNIVLLSLASLGLLAFMVYLFIPGISRIVAYSDVLFVNSFGLPLRSGIYTSFLLIWGFLFAGSWLAMKNKKPRLQIVFTMLLLLVAGYSAYGLTVIRSAAGTPINEANPSHAYSLMAYIEREQYGEQPLFSGQFFNSQPDKRLPYIEAGEHRKPVNGRYETTGKRMKPNFPKREIKPFPRMWSSRPDHIAAYKEWSGTDGLKLPGSAENFRFLTRYQLGHMYLRYFMWNFVGRQNDIQGHGGPLYGNWISGIGFIDKLRLGDPGDCTPVLSDNKARNTYYFLPLLLGIAGLVYQFRRDKKGFTMVSLLFVFTGIAIAFWLNQHPLQLRERDYSYAGSFYSFALWMGIGSFALFQQLKLRHRNFRNAIVVIALFGLAVPVLMGVQNYDDHNKSKRRTSVEMAYNYLTGLAPNAILFTNGDNDTYPLWYLQEVEGIRTDVRVINLSLLNYDYYIDACRKKQYESDPVPCRLQPSDYSAGNRDYIYVYDHVFGMVDKIYETNRVEFDTTMAGIYRHWTELLDNTEYARQKSDEYTKLKKDFLFMAPHGKNPQFKAFRTFTETICKPESLATWGINPEKAHALLLEIDAMLKKQLTKPVPLGDALAFAFSDNPDNKVKHNYSDAQVNYFPSAKMMMDVDPQQLLKTGTLRKDQLQWAVSRMEWTIPKQILTRSDLLVLQIINDNRWERPVYFAVTAGTGSYLGLEKYFALEGMAFRLMPVVNELSEQSIGYVDASLLFNNLKNNFKLQSYADKSVYLDANMRTMASNYRNIFGHCARALYFEGRVKESEEIIDLCLKQIPNDRVPYEYYTAPLIHGYYRINRKKKARETASLLARNTIEHLTYLLAFDDAYQLSLRTEEKKCLATLQYLYRMAKEYNHKEYLPEIEMQYGKMITAFEKSGGKLSEK